MDKISMLELRRDAEAILRRVGSGESLILTYRGQPALRLEPLETDAVRDGGPDPFFRLAGMIDDTEDHPGNAGIDTLIYGG